jgi:preprotein translocase subunit SecG
MSFIIGLLTLVLVVDALVLIFLVLLQLPKKEAGAGLAFGAGATDALFGAGSGNVLTKITKWSATVFFILAVLVGVMQSRFHHRSSSEFERRLSQPSAAPVTPAPSTAPAAVTTGTNAVAIPTPTPVTPVTNASAQPAAQK